jgi:acetate kinase
LGSTNIKRGGFSGLLHSYSLHIAKNKLKIISIVLDSQTTVAAIFKGRPLLVSLGMTPLEGIMGQKSCGDIDPGIIFYLMQKEELNIFQIDNILKEKSGFLGLTGYNIFFKELFSLYGVDKKVTFAFDVYRDQIIKYIGFSLALLEGADAIVFSGKYLDSLRPFIYGLLKRISFLGITLKSLPWQSEGDMVMANSPSSCMSVYLNNLSPVSIISRNSPYSIKK